MGGGAAAGEVEAIEAAERAEAARVALIERIAPAVVCVFDRAQRGGGSGVIIDPQGYGLTNFHVIAELLNERRGLAGLPDGKLYDLRVLGIDPGGDVAMFQLSGREAFPWAPLGDSDGLRVGDQVLALGNPFMLSDDYTPTVTFGTISGLHRYQFGATNEALIYSDCIQVDAAINPGNSGGPLFDTGGRLIGLNGRISVSLRGRVNVGLGYAITINQIKAFLPGLRAGLLVPHGSLQAVVRDEPDGGVVFSELLEDAPAWRAGIRPGDRLLSLDNRSVSSANEYLSILGTLPGDWPVPITWQPTTGAVRKEVLRTEPVQVEGAQSFETDPAANQAAVERVLRRFRQAAGLDSAGAGGPRRWQWSESWSRLPGDAEPTRISFVDEGAGPLRMSWPSGESRRIEVDGDAAMLEVAGAKQPLPLELELYCRALYLLHRTLPADPPVTLPADLRHCGADRRLEPGAEGNAARPKILECLAMPLGDTADGRWQFDADTGRLCRLIARDRPSGRSVEAYFADGVPWSSRVQLRWAEGEATILRTDVQLSPGLRVNATDPAAAPAVLAAPSRETDSVLAPAVVEQVLQRVVKLIGGKVGRAEGYGSGVIISPDGWVLTVDAALLDAPNARAVLPDGRSLRLQRVYADRDRQLALVKLAPAARSEPGSAPGSAPATAPSGEYPFFEVTAARPAPGQWVFAAGNPFKVASGDEQVSLVRGVYGGTIQLDGIRGAQAFPYRGPVLLVDAVTSTPGFAGGALVDVSGRLLGLIGRAVESRVTRTQVSYAVPSEVLVQFVEQARGAGSATGPAESRPTSGDMPTGYHGLDFFDLAYRANPVYVERVRRGSPAARAGMRKGDLVLSVNGRPVADLDAWQRVIADYHAGDTLELTIRRDKEVRTVRLVLEPPP